MSSKSLLRSFDCPTSQQIVKFVGTMLPWLIKGATSLSSRYCLVNILVTFHRDAVGSDEWRELPIEQQMAWTIPIEIMLNITHLRETHPVITTTDYLLLHGYDPSEENTSGYWKRTEYHTRANVITGTIPSFYAIENPWYDPEGTIRVDTIPEGMQARADNYSRVVDGSIDTKLRQLLPEGKSILEWDTVQSALNSTDEAELEYAVVAGGWEVLHTYDSV